MLHMQHANVVSLLVRQNEAARLKGQRDAVAKARRAAATTTAAADATDVAVEYAARRTPAVHRARPA
jgi:hypothetical protein